MPSGRRGRRRPDQVHDCRQTDLRPTPPVPAGEREQPMLDPVPCARPRRKAAAADIDAGFLRQLLQIDLPPPDPSADRAAAIGDRATPVASAIRLTPLQPKLQPFAAAGRRRPFPSECGDSASQRSRTLLTACVVPLHARPNSQDGDVLRLANSRASHCPSDTEDSFRRRRHVRGRWLARRFGGKAAFAEQRQPPRLGRHFGFRPKSHAGFKSRRKHAERQATLGRTVAESGPVRLSPAGAWRFGRFPA